GFGGGTARDCPTSAHGSREGGGACGEYSKHTRVARGWSGFDRAWIGAGSGLGRLHEEPRGRVCSHSLRGGRECGERGENAFPGVCDYESQRTGEYAFPQFSARIALGRDNRGRI